MAKELVVGCALSLIFLSAPVMAQCEGGRGGGGSAAGGMLPMEMSAGTLAGAGMGRGFSAGANPQVFAMAMQQMQMQNQMMQQQMLVMRQQMMELQRQNQQLLAKLQQTGSSAIEAPVALADQGKAAKVRLASVNDTPKPRPNRH